MSKPSSSGDIDPTRMIDQPALRTSSGLVWLLMGGVLTLVCLGVLFLLATIDPVIAWVGGSVIAILYFTMILIRFLIRPKRSRLLTLAVLFCVITGVGLVSVILMAIHPSSALN